MTMKNMVTNVLITYRRDNATMLYTYEIKRTTISLLFGQNASAGEIQGKIKNLNFK